MMVKEEQSLEDQSSIDYHGTNLLDMSNLSRDWVIKNWTDILVSYANDFESAILDLYFPKTTQNFCSSAILHISITFIQF